MLHFLNNYEKLFAIFQAKSSKSKLTNRYSKQVQTCTYVGREMYRQVHISFVFCCTNMILQLHGISVSLPEKGHVTFVIFWAFFRKLDQIFMDQITLLLIIFRNKQTWPRDIPITIHDGLSEENTSFSSKHELRIIFEIINSG